MAIIAHLLRHVVIHISVRDILGVILPGAIVVFVVYAVIELGDTPWLNKLVGAIDKDWIREIAFVFASLCLGYILQIPAKGLDRLYNYTYRAWKLRGLDEQSQKIHNPALLSHYDSSKVPSTEEAAKKAAEIEKLQAVSELFRSLAVISIVVCAIMFWNSNFYPAGTALVFSLACYWIFCDKLWDANEEKFKFLEKTFRPADETG